jgi:dTDP-4-amino-4,6-dideoxy-D-galactose acyltransferase
MTYERLGWDSSFFGLAIGRLSPEQGAGGLAQSVAAADTDGIECLYLLCPTGDDPTLATALDLGFRPYDVRIELERELDAPIRMPPEIHDARPQDVPALERIALERIRGTRFWADAHFPRERVAELYASWLRAAVVDSPARRVLVFGEGEGFVVCRLAASSGTGAIELIAAAVDGRGIGGALTAAAGTVFAAAGFTRATVVTQGRNVPAQRLYQRHGYRTTRVGLWLHRWRVQTETRPPARLTETYQEPR